jgi:RNA polymerase sigma-70 factor (ECF subfamily)
LGRERLQLDEIFSTHAQDVFRYLWSMTADRERAEELTQETFYRAHVGNAHFQGKSSVRTWLLAIARHAYLDELRRAQRCERILGRLIAAFRPQPATTEEVVIARDEWREVRMALNLLPERQRTMLVLREGRGLSYAQIGEVLGASLASVRKNISLARAALRRAHAGIEPGGRPSADEAAGPTGREMSTMKAEGEVAHAVRSGAP